jgi:hypothetical protein
MRGFLLTVLASVIGAAIYKNYMDQPNSAMRTSIVSGDARPPVIGATMLTRMPVFPGISSEAGHGDAILNANPSIAYTPAFGADTNKAAPLDEWSGAGLHINSLSSSTNQYA